MGRNLWKNHAHHGGPIPDWLGMPCEYSKLEESSHGTRATAVKRGTDGACYGGGERHEGGLNQGYLVEVRHFSGRFVG